MAKLARHAEAAYRTGNNFQQAMGLFRLAAHALSPVSEHHERNSFAPIVLDTRALSRMRQAGVWLCA